MSSFRKSLFFLACFISFSCLSTPTEAGEWEREYARYHASESLTKPKNYTFEITPEIYWFFYEEPSLSVEWDGVMYGFRASLTQRAETKPFIGRLEGSYSIGSVDYDGFLSNGTPHTTSGTDWIYETRGLFGYEWEKGQTALTPFLGIAFRYWRDDLESVNSYQRDVRYLYSPIGFETRTLLGERWAWGIRAEYNLFWRGWVDSHLNDVNPLFNTIENRQEQGFGARGSFYLKRFFRKYTFSIEPFIRYWDIDDSDTAPLTFAGVLIGSGVEPANSTIESGLQVSLIW